MMTQAETLTVASVGRLMRDPSTYPEHPSLVEVIETHLSWVFLTSRHAYKLKKPLRFEFVDLTRIAARRQACENELRLNRRLAAYVYLQVLPIALGAEGRLELGGTGPAVDWVVKMQRLPAECALDRLVRSQQVNDVDVDRISRTLVAFYGSLVPLVIPTHQYPDQIQRHVRANWQDLQSVDTGPSSCGRHRDVERVHAAQLRYLQLARHEFLARACDGRIVDGHGDLRPEHIYLLPAPAIIDCLEFSEELRQVDVADELAFFAMECDRLAASWIGDRVLSVYQRAAKDVISPALMSFYRSYRACVRAKVHHLRAGQLPADRATLETDARDAYLSLASEYAERLGRPMVIILRGLSGSGKSTLAQALVDRTACRWLQTDRLRNRLSAASHEGARYNRGTYTRGRRSAVYRAMLARARTELRDGLSVVLDGTFLAREWREQAVEMAIEMGAFPLVVHCHCPDEVARQRIVERLKQGRDPSQAWPQLLRLQRQEEEPDRRPLPTLDVDMTKGIGPALDALFPALAESLEPASPMDGRPDHKLGCAGQEGVVP